MSRLFEFLQNVVPVVVEPGGARGSKGTERDGEAGQILSVLHREDIGAVHAGSAQALPDATPVQCKDLQVRPAFHVVYHDDPGSPAADRFRLLRMRLHECSRDRRLRRLLITSPLPKDGKSTVALNVATALAEHGKRKVLLIDADLHCSSLCRQFGEQAGLAECLESALNPLSAIWRLRPLSCYWLPAGRAAANATELLQNGDLAGVMRQLEPHFEWIVVDSPPVLPLTDSISLTQHTDAALLVARADVTSRKAIGDAMKLLGPKHVLAVVLNGVKGLNRTYSKYKGYYGYHGDGGRSLKNSMVSNTDPAEPT